MSDADGEQFWHMLGCGLRSEPQQVGVCLLLVAASGNKFAKIKNEDVGKPVITAIIDFIADASRIFFQRQQGAAFAINLG